MADDTSNVFDPSLVLAMLQASTVPETQALAKQRMQYGHEDYQTPSPQGYRVGGTYMAASPLEHIASALRQGVGLAQQRRAMSDVQGLIGQQGQARSAMAQAIDRLFRNQQQAPTSPEPFTGEAPQMVGPGVSAADYRGMGRIN